MRYLSHIIAFALVCIAVAIFFYGVRAAFEKTPYTYEDCMMSNMYNRPSSMHEIISRYCKKEIKPIVKFYDMDTTKEEDR